MLVNRRRVLALSTIAATAIGLAACSNDAGTGAEPGGSGDPDSPETTTVEVTDNHGTQTVPQPAQRIVVTDNRLFETVAAWQIPLVAAARSLMPADNPYKNDESIADLGSHNEPDLEAVVAADPDLVLNGQRFAQYRDDFASLVPDAAIVELDPREGESVESELKRQVETLGTIFDKADEAAAIIDDFDTAVQAVKDAYDPALTVMTVITSGGEINYSAPVTGRTLGPVFDMLGLTPSLEADGSGDHEGDDISVEAIAASDPDIILVMDRDAALAANSGDDYKPANDLISNSEALQNVSAVKEGKIAYMPQNTYLNEGIQTYTTFFNSIAKVL